MTERVEEIRRHWEQQHAIREGMREKGVEPSPSWYDEEIPYLLTALAQAEREREKATERASQWADIAGGHGAEVDRLRAEVKRLGTDRVAKAEYERVCALGDYVTQRAEQAEADLARVRAALDREHICVMEACCNDAVRAALEGRG